MSENAPPTVPKWFFWLGLGIGLGCCVLLVAFYIRNPGRTFFADFRRPEGLGVPDTNGAVPHPPAQAGAAADVGTEAGEAV